jgi:hypothetical protein
MESIFRNFSKFELEIFWKMRSEIFIQKYK